MSPEEKAAFMEELKTEVMTKAVRLLAEAVDVHIERLEKVESRKFHVATASLLLAAAMSENVVDGTEEHFLSFATASFHLGKTAAKILKEASEVHAKAEDAGTPPPPFPFMGKPGDA